MASIGLAPQALVGLREDGCLNKATKQALLRVRNDQNPDEGLEADRPTHTGRRVLTYAVGPVPGYLSRQQVRLREMACGSDCIIPYPRPSATPLATRSRLVFVRRVICLLTDGAPSCRQVLQEIGDALGQWGAATGIRFSRRTVGSALDGGDFVIEWSDMSESNELRFDGPGGRLAQGSAHAIRFDASERWLVGEQTAAPGRPAYRFLAVLLHEAGHLLGLGHSTNSRDVMSPFYTAHATQLTHRDAARARALYQGTAPSWSPQQMTAWVERHRLQVRGRRTSSERQREGRERGLRRASTA